MDRSSYKYLYQGLTRTNKYYNVNNLMEILEILSEDGCPWDRNRLYSIKPNLIEESCEVLGSYRVKDDVLLEEELGDLLLRLYFIIKLPQKGKPLRSHR